MKLSQETLSLLKNFASINANILVKPGNSLATISESKNILAVANISETFDREFGIYDLSEFLSAISLVDSESAEFNFSDSHVEVSSGKTKVAYYYADPSLLTVPTKTVIKMPAEDITFTLSEENTAKIKKAAGVFGHSIFTIEAKNGVIDVTVSDPKQSSSNKYTLTVDEDNSVKSTLSYMVSIGNLKMISGSYTVTLCSRVAHFKNNLIPVEYWISLDTPKK